MIKIGGGSVVFVNSNTAYRAIPDRIAYSASKSGALGMMRALAFDLGKYNIRVNCIAPAAIMTEMVKESNLNDPEFDNEFFLHQITPLRRWGKPEDVANVACFLASDEGAYLNGTVISADGGITINGNVNKEKY